MVFFTALPEVQVPGLSVFNLSRQGFLVIVQSATVMFAACCYLPQKYFAIRLVGEGKAKRPVDKHLGLPFHGTRCASDPNATSYW